MVSREGTAYLFPVNFCWGLMRSKCRGLYQQGFPSQLLDHCHVLLLCPCNVLKWPEAVTAQIWLVIHSARSKTHFNHKATIVGWGVIPRVTITSIFLFQWKTLTTNKSNVRQADYNVGRLVSDTRVNLRSWPQSSKFKVSQKFHNSFFSFCFFCSFTFLMVMNTCSSRSNEKHNFFFL